MMSMKIFSIYRRVVSPTPNCISENNRKRTRKEVTNTAPTRAKLPRLVKLTSSSLLLCLVGELKLTIFFILLYIVAMTELRENVLANNQAQLSLNGYFFQL